MIILTNNRVFWRIPGSIEINFFENIGGLTFNRTAVTTQFTTGSEDRTIKLADLDGDQRLDITVFNGNATGGFETLINDGSGNFTQGQNETGIGNSRSVGDVGDIDGDGDIDLVTNGAVYLNDGTGNFSQNQLIGGVGAKIGDTLADFDNDGDLDYVTSHGASAPGLTFATYYEGNGDGTFQSAATFASTQSNPRLFDLTAGDFNGDGFKDVAILDTQNNTIEFFANDPEGTFTSVSTVSNATGIHPTIASADFNGDGILDIISESGVNLGQTTTTLRAPELDLNSMENARDSIAILKTQINRVTAARGDLGASSSRLESALGMLQEQALQLDSARSRIVDADVAAEVAELVRLQILQQAGTAVLAQANQQPAVFLNLLS